MGHGKRPSDNRIHLIQMVQANHKAKEKTLSSQPAKKALITGEVNPPHPINHIVVYMIPKIKRLDQGMVFMFILWLFSVDFNHISTLSWISGGLIVAYLIFFAVRGR